MIKFDECRRVKIVPCTHSRSARSACSAWAQLIFDEAVSPRVRLWRVVGGLAYDFSAERNSSLMAAINSNTLGKASGGIPRTVCKISSSYRRALDIGQFPPVHRNLAFSHNFPPKSATDKIASRLIMGSNPFEGFQHVIVSIKMVVNAGSRRMLKVTEFSPADL